MDLKERVISLYKLTEAEWDESIKCFITDTIKARSYFVKEGKVSDRIGYIKSGLFRSFIFTDDGDEVTTHFFQPGTVVISMDSFNRQVPAKENIVALEDSELLVLTYKKVNELYQKVPVWQQITKDVDEFKFQDQLNRSISFQTLSATERYQLFCQNYPEIIKKVALRHIASYLGIDIATLSRIRRKI